MYMYKKQEDKGRLYFLTLQRLSQRSKTEFFNNSQITVSTGASREGEIEFYKALHEKSVAKYCCTHYYYSF